MKIKRPKSCEDLTPDELKGICCETIILSSYIER